MYHFESANTVCDQFNRLINTLRKEEETSGTDKYQWLDDSDERKYMMDREILDKYIDLEMLCNPKFVYKINQCFDLSSIYFLYPLTSLPKMVKQEVPASIKQS